MIKKTIRRSAMRVTEEWPVEFGKQPKIYTAPLIDDKQCVDANIKFRDVLGVDKILYYVMGQVYVLFTYKMRVSDAADVMGYTCRGRFVPTQLRCKSVILTFCPCPVVHACFLLSTVSCLL